MRRIVLFVEGEGEAAAMPRLVKRLLTAQNAWDAVTLDDAPFRVGHVGKLVKDECKEWKRWLAAALKRANVGAVLLVLDGDVERIGKEPFCVAAVAKRLAGAAAEVRGGASFSVAVVFARQEYESWLIAGVESLAGKRLPDGRLVSPKATPPATNLEESPRDAKGWLAKVIEDGYKPTRDQAPLTDLVDLQCIRDRKLGSFRRLENAVTEVVAAIRNNQPVATPA